MPAGAETDRPRLAAVRACVALEQSEQLRRGRALVVGRRRVVDEQQRRLAQLADALRQLGAAADLERQLASGGAQRLEDTGEHASQAVGAIRREQAKTVRVAA